MNRVDSTTVSNPLLWEKGIKTMLGVPLLRGDKVLGVLHVGRPQERPFSDDDVELLLVVGDRVTAAFETRGTRSSWRRRQSSWDVCAVHYAPIR